MSLILYVMLTLREPLVGQPILPVLMNIPHLSGLELADTSSNSSTLPINALISSDYYWQLVKGVVCRGTSGLVAIHTKLGWVLSGPSSRGDADRVAMNLSITHVLHSEANHIHVELSALSNQP